MPTPAAAIFHLGRVNTIMSHLPTHQTLFDDSKVENFFAAAASSGFWDSTSKYLDQYFSGRALSSSVSTTFCKFQSGFMNTNNLHSSTGRHLLTMSLQKDHWLTQSELRLPRPVSYLSLLHVRSVRSGSASHSLWHCTSVIINRK